MAKMVTARVRLLGGSRIMRLARGIRSSEARAQRKSRSDTKKTEETVKKGAKAGAKANKRAAEEAADSVKRNEQKKRNEFKRTTREGKRSAKALANEWRRSGREARNAAAAGAAGGGGRRGGGGRMRRAAAMGAGAIVGGLRGLGQMGSNAQGIAGVRGGADVLGSMVRTNAELTRAIAQGRRGAAGSVRRRGGDASGVAGRSISSIQHDVTSRAAAIGERHGVSTEQVMQAVARSQTQFSQLATAIEGGEGAMDSLFAAFDVMAQVSKATGTEMETVAAAGFAMQRQLGLSAEELPQALDVLNQGALEGSLTLRDFAERFPQAISTFLAARGGLSAFEGGGMQALQEFSAIAQAMESGSEADPRAVRTRMQALFNELSNNRVQRNLRRQGVEVSTDRSTGAVSNLSDIIHALSGKNSGQGLSLQQLRGLGFSSEGAQAISQLVGAEHNSGATLEQRSQASAADGAALRQETNRALDNSAAGRAQRAAANREARLARGSEELIDQFASLAETMSAFEDAFPMLTHGGGGSAISSALAGAGLGGLMSGGGMGGAASRVASGGSAVAAMGGGGALGAAKVGGGVTLAAGAGLLAGRGIAHALDSVSGAREGSGLVAAQDDALEAIQRSLGLRDDGGQGIGEQIAETFRFLGEQMFGEDTPSNTPQQVTLDQRSAEAIAQAAQAAAPGSGRRTEGGPTERGN